jgi:hypothetical protein
MPSRWENATEETGFFRSKQRERERTEWAASRLHFNAARHLSDEVSSVGPFLIKWRGCVRNRPQQLNIAGFINRPAEFSALDSTAVYGVEMTDQHHSELAKLLAKCRSKVVLSGYPSDLYQKLYGKWRRVDFDIANHAASGKTKGRETGCPWMDF